MKLTTKLAYAQIKGNRARSAWTLVGIILATMMITAIFGFAESARLGVYNAVVAERGDWHLLLQPFFSEGEAAEIASDEAVGGYSIQSKANQDGSMFWGIHFRLAKPGRDYMAQLEQICARHGFDLYGAGNYYNVNEEVLSLEGHGDNRTAKQFYGIAAILAVIIIAVSAVVISNAFKVSAGERVRQFGLLKSAGATKRHIVQIVLKEGLILSAAGIPLGALAGLGLDAATLAGANQMISAVSPTAPAGFEFEFTAAPAVLAAAAAFAFAAVMLSSYFPARRAAKIAAIDAIRQAGEIKLKARPMRPMKLVNKLFGFEGELAAKSMRRSRRAYRATVVSLTAGVVLFIACGEFIYSFRKTLDTGFSDMSVTAQITCYSSDTDMAYERIRRLTERFEEYENAAVYFQGYNRINRRNLETSLPEDMLTDEFKSLFASFMNGINPERVNVEYVVADDATYNELISQANAKSGDAILLNRARLYYSNESYEYTPFIFKETTLTVRDENGMEREVALAGEARDLPQRFLNGFSGVLILLPEMDATFVYWHIDVPDSAGFTQFAQEVLAAELPDGFQNAYVEDVAAQAASQRAMADFITAFLYAFAGLLTLIGLTNVVSAVSANMRLRSREFAVLQSVGMTRGGLRRMMYLECVMYASKSLAYGLPLGAAACAAIYAIFSIAESYTFVFPWINALECVAGVFAVTLITMRAASPHRRASSLTESIRGYDGA